VVEAHRRTVAPLTPLRFSGTGTGTFTGENSGIGLSWRAWLGQDFDRERFGAPRVAKLARGAVGLALT
jgi:hypothetical protein